MRKNSSFGKGVPPGRPDASARRPYPGQQNFLSHPSQLPGVRCGILLGALLLQAGLLPAQPITDSGVTQAVEQTLAREKGVFPDNVDVSTKDGIVTLTGSVDNLLARDRVLKVTEGIRGVMGVIGEINVTPVSRPDEEVRKDILTALLLDPATESYQVNIRVHDGLATLTGEAGSYAEKQMVERIAEGVKGVKKINNELAIHYTAPNSDQQIAADANARLHWDTWINGGAINAAANNGVVTLTGTVNSVISKSRAFDDAWVSGVKSVDDADLKVSPQGPRMKLNLSDSQIRGAILASYRFDPRVSPFSPAVSVTDGVVLLGGRVGNLKAKTAAEQDASNITGVSRVENYLRVRPAKQLTDAELQDEVRAALARDPLLDGTDIEAAVVNRVAYLSGDAETELARGEAQDVAARIKGLLAIRNRVKTEPEAAVYSVEWPYYSFTESPYYNQPPRALADVLGPNPSDADIKRKIEDALVWSPLVERKDINVTVDDGVAVLKGTVPSWIGWREADKDAHESGAAYVIDKVKVNNQTE